MVSIPLKILCLFLQILASLKLNLEILTTFASTELVSTVKLSSPHTGNLSIENNGLSHVHELSRDKKKSRLSTRRQDGY